MDAPIRPAPSEFGITDKDVSRLPELIFRPPAGSPLRKGLCLATTFLITFILLNHFLDGDWSRGRWVVALLGGPFATLLGGGLTMGFYSVLGSIENNIRLMVSPTFRRATRYRSAMDGYRKDIAKYNEWMAAKEREQAAKEREQRRQQETYWRALSGMAFESELAHLFRGLGYKVSQTPRTGDGGVDLILHKDGKVTVVQCKAHNKKIPIGTARELIASMQDFQAHDAIIACLEGATKPVQDYIATKPIRVINVCDILELQRGLRQGHNSHQRLMAAAKSL
jgi:HJR/Mrr/RecB family endonuclease